MAANVFGYDLAYNVTNNDLLPVDQLVTGNKLVGQRIARMLVTPLGALANYDPDPAAKTWGWDCRQYMNGKFGAADVASAQAHITNAILQDEQVKTADVKFSFVAGSNSVATISASITTADGPFVLTIDVQSATSQIIFNSGF